MASWSAESLLPVAASKRFEGEDESRDECDTVSNRAAEPSSDQEALEQCHCMGLQVFYANILLNSAASPHALCNRAEWSPGKRLSIAAHGCSLQRLVASQGRH